MNLCSQCKSTHDNNHKIINYNDKELICLMHIENYNSYCNKCEKNICSICEKEHNEHPIIYYDQLIIPENIIINKMKKIKQVKDKFITDIKEKINKLNIIGENIENYYKIIDSIIKNTIFIKKKNYQILKTLNDIIYNNNIFNKIERINKNNNKYDDIIEIYDKIYNRNNENIDIKIINKNNNTPKRNNENINIKNKINNNIIINKNNENIDTNIKNNDYNIIYKINKNEDRIRIFGDHFVKNNKNKIKLKIEGEEYELKEFYILIIMKLHFYQLK